MLVEKSPQPPFTKGGLGGFESDKTSGNHYNRILRILLFIVESSWCRLFCYPHHKRLGGLEKFPRPVPTLEWLRQQCQYFVYS
jgi:hypothetical protein